MRPARWTGVEVARLRQHWPGGDLAQMESLFPGRSLPAIKHMAFRLRIKPHRKTKWTPTELLILKTMWGKHRKREIDAKLNRRTPASIYNKARELGLMKKRGSKSFWTKPEIELLSSLWPHASPEEITKAIPNHSWASITAKASHVGIRRVWRSAPKSPRNPLMIALRKRRLAMGLHAVDLAKRMGYPRTSLMLWELSKSAPRFNSLLTWCEALGVELTIQPRNE